MMQTIETENSYLLSDDLKSCATNPRGGSHKTHVNHFLGQAHSFKDLCTLQQQNRNCYEVPDG